MIDRSHPASSATGRTRCPKPGESRLQTLGRTYVEALSERRAELMVHLHAYASAEDPDIAAAMRHHLARTFRYVVHLLERDGHPAAYDEAGRFVSRGFLINAAMAVGLESVMTPEEWAGSAESAKSRGSKTAWTGRPRRPRVTFFSSKSK